MRRDVKRRQMVKQYAVERLRITALRRNTIIPQEVQVWTQFGIAVDGNLHQFLSQIVQNICNNLFWDIKFGT